MEVKGGDSHQGTSAPINSYFPGDPGPLFRGPASKAPGCLGTIPSKYARAASLSGKHGLPLPPPYHHHPCQLCSVGTLWGQCMVWASGHLGPNPILEPKGLGATSAHSGTASSSIYWGHDNAHLPGEPDGRDRDTWGAVNSVLGDMQAGANGCHGAYRRDTNGLWHCHYLRWGSSIPPSLEAKPTWVCRVQPV